MADCPVSTACVLTVGCVAVLFARCVQAAAGEVQWYLAAISAPGSSDQVQCSTLMAALPFGS
jgi:hypothetical protein